MSKDTLFLIEPGFEDPKRPGTRFFCPYCNQIEGLLANFPDLTTRLDIRRVGFARPRETVITAVGEENQSLPLLVFGGEAPEDALAHGGARFVRDTERILALLAERHGFPHPH